LVDLIAMDTASILAALAGGALIGTSAAALLLLTGRIAGVSGIVGGLLTPQRNDTLWRALFIAGLVTGGVLLEVVAADPFRGLATASPARLLVAGLLVGYGARRGNGCTSGHGVCGVSRMSPRSLVATAVFMTTGVLTVFVSRHLLGRLP
jgi:uncharacterized membrane protein YedE/YeeE